MDYVNWEKPSLLGGDDYSVLKPEPRQASLDQDYSHLELPDLPTERTDVSRNPTGPPPKDKGVSSLLYLSLHLHTHVLYHGTCLFMHPLSTMLSAHSMYINEIVTF